MVCEEAGTIDGRPCDECGGSGMIDIRECPRRFVGNEITEAINVAGLCGNGILPVAGGIMDQSAWFVALWQQLQSDQSEIDAEEMEKMRHVG